MKVNTGKLITGGYRHEPLWYPASRKLLQMIPVNMRPWLLDTASLTQRLIQITDGNFQVQLCDQGWRRPMLNERFILDMRNDQYGIVRQVRLLCHGDPWVFARTVIPKCTLIGKYKRFAYLGNKPLGAMLFADKSIQRSKLQIARILPGQKIFNDATQVLTKRPNEIWGRRSIFSIANRPLLVSEIFLPAVAAVSLDI